MIDELSIKNASLSIPFSPLNNEYTAIVGKEVDTLEFIYSADSSFTVVINNNHDLQNNSVVELIVSDGENKASYHFQILKEEEEQTKTTFLEKKEEEQISFLKEYKNYIVPFFCILLILFSYRLLFHKKKII